MTQDNPFTRLGTLDQQLYKETSQKQQENSANHVDRQEKHIKKENQQKSHDTMTPRNHDTTQPRNHGTTIPQDEDPIFEVVRRSVKQIGKEAATHRFTLEEKNLLADIEYTYKRQGIRTSENEITRIAINYFLEEYRQNGEQSILGKILKLLNA